MPWYVVVGLAALCAYGIAVLGLLAAGRRMDARALGGFVPDCAVLLSRLSRRPCVGRRRVALIALAGYLALPIDLVPDFLPLVGHLDDAIVVALTLRWLTRRCSVAELSACWPGPDASLGVVLRLAGVRR